MGIGDDSEESKAQSHVKKRILNPQHNNKKTGNVWNILLIPRAPSENNGRMEEIGEEMEQMIIVQICKKGKSNLGMIGKQFSGTKQSCDKRLKQRN